MDAGRRKKQPSAWIMHVKAYSKKHGIKFGDALSKAGASFKHSGGQLMGKATGGTRKRRRGGALYGFSGGPYTGSELSDGAGRFPAYNLSDNQYPGNPGAMTAGRRTRHRRRR